MSQVISLLILLLLFLWPSIVFAHEGTEISVQGEVRADGSITLEGEEFAPNDVVRIELRKEGLEPILLGQAHADARGAFEETLHVPAGVRPGLYELAADGKESAKATVTILGTSNPGQSGSPRETTEAVSYDRPTGETIGLAVFVAILTAAGAAAHWVSRTRPHLGGA